MIAAVPSFHGTQPSAERASEHNVSSAAVLKLL